MSGLPSAIAALYTGNQAGKSYLAGTGSRNRYARVPEEVLLNKQMAGGVSSATLYMPKGGGCTLLLFRREMAFDPDYQGEYIEYVNFSGNQWDVQLGNQQLLSGGNWNNEPTSALVVRTQATVETRRGARSEWSEAITSLVDSALQSGNAQLPVGQVVRDGNPTFQLVPFPVGVSNLSENAIYIKVRQALTIALPVVPDYAAAVSFWVHLKLTTQKTLTGHVDRWRVWVEGGFKSGTAKDKLADAVIKALPNINTLIGGWCASQPSPLADVYFLPGTQLTTTKGKDILKGSSHDDSEVTIVLANPPQIPE